MNHSLSYRDFISSIHSELRAQLPDGLQLSLGSRTEEGRAGKDAFVITKEDGSTAGLFYAEDLFDRYRRGRSVEEIAELALLLSTSTRLPEEAKSILDPGYAKDHLLLRLVHFERNRKESRGCIMRPFLDLALTCRVVYPSDASILKTAAVTQSLLSHWGFSEEELFSLAGDCMRRSDPPVLRPLRDMVPDSMCGPDYLPGQKGELYILTTESGLSGACALLFSGCVQQMAQELGRDILILPSSVHEVLLLPDWGNWKVSALRAIVSEVNRTVVSAADYLSDSVYRYSLREDRFLMED